MRFVVWLNGAAEVLGSFFLVLEEEPILRDWMVWVANFSGREDSRSGYLGGREVAESGMVRFGEGEAA